MAKPRKRGNSWSIQLVVNKKRQNFPLGMVDETEAYISAGHLNRIINAEKEGVPPPPDSIAWLEKANPKIKEILTDLGLHNSIRKTWPTEELVKLFNRYYDNGKRSKNTIVRMKQYSSKLTEFFGPRLIDQITFTEAQEFLDYLKTEYPAEATWTKGLQRCKQVFLFAVDQGFITKSPLRSLKGGKYDNPARMVQVPANTVREIIDTMPPGDFQVILALARFCGLRIPSELAQLTWDRVNLPKKIMVVWDAKRKRDRVVPLFPDAFSKIEEQYQRYGSTSSHVVSDPTLRQPDANLRTTLNKYVRRAGFESWTKPFQNLRASCETDLMKHYPIHQVVKWIGNSVNVALKHYAMVSEKDVAEALAKQDPFKSDVTEMSHDNLQKPTNETEKK